MKYFVHFTIWRNLGGISEEEFFFNGCLGDAFHDIMSTTRYYASREVDEDAWDVEAVVYNDVTGEYICTLRAAAYNPGILVIREEE